MYTDISFGGLWQFLQSFDRRNRTAKDYLLGGSLQACLWVNMGFGFTVGIANC